MRLQHIKNLQFPSNIDEKEEKTAWEGNQEVDPNAQLLYAARPVMRMSRILNSSRYGKLNHCEITCRIFLPTNSH